ncbi:MAG: hypothetical protein KBD26_03040 [Candidatus Pacebacteria bacterium]|nr:hypothetical protein [Candidatus Paceibacterota bacterium]MBP9772784.1 hypothetical protein [Candidatus Paceibacterota bacterium]
MVFTKQTKGIVLDLKKKTLVKITKVHMDSGENSSIPVGRSYKGTIQNENFEVLDSFRVSVLSGGMMNTSSVLNVTKTEGGDFIIETMTSTYLIQLL